MSHLLPKRSVVILFCAGILLLLTPDPSDALGMKDYGDDCDTSQSYSAVESGRCNSDRGLYCNPVRSECKCIISSAYYQRGKCRGKVNNPCGLMDNFIVECVKNAICSNQTLGVCLCPSHLFGNEEGTACSTNANSAPPSYALPVLLLLLSTPVALIGQLN